MSDNPNEYEELPKNEDVENQLTFYELRIKELEQALLRQKVELEEALLSQKNRIHFSYREVGSCSCCEETLCYRRH